MKNIAVDLIEKWNDVKGKTISAKSQSNLNLVNRAISEYGVDVVEQVIDETSETNIYRALSLVNISNHIRTKVGAEKLPEGKQVADSLKGMTFGVLAELISEMAQSKVDFDVIKDRVDEYIVEKYGPLTKSIEYKFGDKVVIPSNEITHEKFETLLKFVQADEPVMMVGPAGSGKNVLVEQIAKALGLNFYMSNAVTEEYQIKGFVDAMGKYHETEFYRAFTKGGVFFLDEIDGSIPETLIMLNGAIANRYFDFPSYGKVSAHPDFRVIAAANTYGTGATYQYVGRYQLDGASLNRFAVVGVGYSPAIEKKVCPDNELRDFVVDFRKSCDEGGINHIVSYRELGRLYKMIKQYGLNDKEALETCLIKNLQRDDLRQVLSGMSVDTKNKYRKELKDLC